jgi:hypothetical protein
MIQSFKILFLGIAIFFSFGFTTRQSVCHTEMNKEKLCCESQKTCCSSKKTEKKKDCNKECCFKTDNILELESCFIEQNLDNVINVVSKNLLSSELCNTVGINKEEVLIKIHPQKPKIIGNHILCIHQSWLI